jgi:hypothetical protein
MVTQVEKRKITVRLSLQKRGQCNAKNIIVIGFGYKLIPARKQKD